MTQNQIKSALKAKLSTESRWTARAIVRLFERQTQAERAIGQTTDANSIGFSGCDAEILSSFATQILAGRTLSPKQLAIAFRKVPRYWKQISTLIPEEKLQAIVREHVALRPTSPNYENSEIAMLAGN